VLTRPDHARRSAALSPHDAAIALRFAASMSKLKLPPRSPAIVPQATLANVRVVVDALQDRPATKQTLMDETDISDRHIDYVVQASTLLGFVDTAGERFRLTDLGRALARSAAGSEEERATFREAMTASANLKALAPDLLHVAEPTREELAARLARVGSLSPDTANQRAGTLLQWRRRVLSPQTKLRFRKSAGMWRRIEIENYRSIKSSTVVLAPFTVLVGPNGSGKSNFADALVFARDVALDAATALASRGGIVGVRRWRPSKPTDVTLDLRAASSRDALENSYVRHLFKIHSGKTGAYAFSSEEISVVERAESLAKVTRKDQKLSGRPPLGAAPSPTASAMTLAKQLTPFEKTSALRNVRRYRLNPDEMRKPRVAADDTRLSESGANIAGAVRSIKHSGGHEAIMRPMQKIIPGLEDLRVEQVGRHEVLRFKQRQDGDHVAEFEATEMSEGALRALGIVVAAHQMERDELLIIEEPEVSIHSGAAGLLFDVLKEASERGAVLLTTHSADLLDKAKDEEILVCSYREGVTNIGPLARAQRQVVRDGLFSLAELMRSEPLRIEGHEDRALPARKRGR
jgi:type I restriction enzyme M protein